MLKKLQIIFKSIFWMASALYLGYAFFDLFLKSFIPDSLMASSVLLLGIGFFFVMGWLGTTDTSKAGKTKVEDLPVAQSATNSRSRIMWETLSPSSHQFQALAFSELAERIAQWWQHGKGQNEQTESAIVRTTTRSCKRNCKKNRPLSTTEALFELYDTPNHPRCS